MNRLIIIGNGFDLAHGLKTSYCDFIDWIFEEKSKPENTIENNFFKINFDKLNALYNVEDFKCEGHLSKWIFRNPAYFGVNRKEIVTYPNAFFRRLIYAHKLNNWVDIENEYYNSLLDTLGKEDSIKLVEKLNKEFGEVKNLLQKYLSKLNCKVHRLNYDRYFEIPLKNEIVERIIVLNFNYTNSLASYFEWIQNFINDYKLIQINIHGELNSFNNPIVFGYGDEKHHDYDKILNNPNFNNNFLENVKHYNYLQRKNYDSLLSYLDHKEFDVQIFGHSCGNSDRTLLNEIFEHKNLSKKGVHILRRGDVSEDEQRKYFNDIVIQLSRVLNNSADVRKKVKNFEDSEIMPCHNTYRN
jgi:hypothetical protein